MDGLIIYFKINKFVKGVLKIMSKNNLKNQIYDSIDELNDGISSMEDLIQELDNTSDIDCYDLYRGLNVIKSSLENIEDKFSDFENEVDNIYITISDLLGKVGN